MEAVFRPLPEKQRRPSTNSLLLHPHDMSNINPCLVSTCVNLTVSECPLAHEGSQRRHSSCRRLSSCDPVGTSRQSEQGETHGRLPGIGFPHSNGRFSRAQPWRKYVSQVSSHPFPPGQPENEDSDILLKSRIFHSGHSSD